MVDMEWNGLLQVGQPNITLWGTAESIYKQIIKFNPNWDAELGPKEDSVAERDTIVRRWGEVSQNVLFISTPLDSSLSSKRSPS